MRRKQAGSVTKEVAYKIKTAKAVLKMMTNGMEWDKQRIAELDKENETVTLANQEGKDIKRHIASNNKKISEIEADMKARTARIADVQSQLDELEGRPGCRW
jgi:hypothetical protein